MLRIKATLLFVIIFAIIANLSYATDCPPGQEKKGWKCVDIEDNEGGGSSSSATIGDISNRNTNTNINGNYNTNENTNKNTNMNTNLNSNTNKQAQGQAQGQVAVAGAVNAGNNQSVVIKDQSTKVQNIVDFNHITPSIGRTSAEHKSVPDTMVIKTLSDIDSMITSISLKSAQKLGSDTTSYKVFKELLFENDFHTSMLINKPDGKFMGTITLVPTGSKVTLGGMQGRAYEEAMKAGATNCLLSSDVGQYTEGSKAGVDIGGAASAVAKSDGSTVIAPGATLGYSTAWSNNEYRPAVIIQLFFDETAVITTVPVQVTTMCTTSDVSTTTPITR